MKRTFSSMSDGGLSSEGDRDSKLRKVDEIKSMREPNKLKNEKTSPQESNSKTEIPGRESPKKTEESKFESLENDTMPMNIVNMKLMFLPPIIAPDDPNVMFIMRNGQKTSSNESLSQEELNTFKREVDEAKDRLNFNNNNAELINAR